MRKKNVDGTHLFTPRLRPSVIQNSGAGYHGAVLIFSATSKGINATEEARERETRFPKS